MAKTISIINQKGGVGKTATTVHLGAYLSEKGYKTLIIDFDAQTDSSRSLGAKNDNYTIYDFLTISNKNFSLYNPTSSPNLFVLVGDRNIKELSYKKNLLKDKLQLINNHFDFILIDCNPHLIEFNRITLNEVALTASDFVVIPTESDPNSLYDTNLFIPDVLEIKKTNNPDLILLGILFSKVEVNTKIFNNAFNDLKEDGNSIVFDSFIRKDEKLKHSQLKGQTIFEYDRKSNAYFDFVNFGDEFLSRIENFK